VTVRKVVMETVQPKLVEKLPSALQSLQIQSFDLGQDLPLVDCVEVWEAPCLIRDKHRRGLELHISLRLDSHVDIQFGMGMLSAGISSLALRGKLVVRLEPLLDEEPIVGGIVCYFLDPPTIDLHFRGVAQLADSSLFASRVRSTIDTLVANAVVLPNVQAVSLAKNEE